MTLLVFIKKLIFVCDPKYFCLWLCGSFCQWFLQPMRPIPEWHLQCCHSKGSGGRDGPAQAAEDSTLVISTYATTTKGTCCVLTIYCSICFPWITLLFLFLCCFNFCFLYLYLSFGLSCGYLWGLYSVSCGYLWLLVTPCRMQLCSHLMLRQMHLNLLRANLLPVNLQYLVFYLC